MSLSCGPLSFMPWVVTASLKNEISLQEMEKFRRVGASIWKNLLLYEGRGRSAAAALWNIKNDS